MDIEYNVLGKVGFSTEVTAVVVACSMELFCIVSYRLGNTTLVDLRGLVFILVLLTDGGLKTEKVVLLYTLLYSAFFGFVMMPTPFLP